MEKSNTGRDMIRLWELVELSRTLRTYPERSIAGMNLLVSWFRNVLFRLIY